MEAKVLLALLPVGMDGQHPGHPRPCTGAWGTEMPLRRRPPAGSTVSPEHDCQQFKSVTRPKTMAPDILTGMNKYESWLVEMNFICFKPFETKLLRQIWGEKKNSQNLKVKCK